MTATWAWVALAGLGAFHGLNPAMGWLFAVALGLQHRSRAAVLWSLVPIAAGHALSIAIVVLAVGVLSRFVDLAMLQIGAGVATIGFGVYRFIAPHRARGGMQVSNGDLALWSFLMATAHGAGIMLLPVLLTMPVCAPAHDHGTAMAALAGDSASIGLAVVGAHTFAMLAVAGIIAVAVYQWLGLAFLRRGWINLDHLWAIALIGAGVVQLALTLA